jgi:UrcA family protein
MTQTLKIILGSALITAAALKAIPALAEIVPAPVNVSIVHTSGLNLSSDAGRRRLDVRLANAAREVCGIASDSDLAGKKQVRACRDDVLAKARAEAQPPVLVAAAH